MESSRRFSPPAAPRSSSRSLRSRAKEGRTAAGSSVASGTVMRPVTRRCVSPAQAASSCRQILRRRTGLLGLSADVHLEQDLQRPLLGSGAALQLEGQRGAVDRLDDVERPDGVPGLVPLQVSDEVPAQAGRVARGRPAPCACRAPPARSSRRRRRGPRRRPRPPPRRCGSWPRQRAPPRQGSRPARRAAASMRVRTAARRSAMLASLTPPAAAAGSPASRSRASVSSMRQADDVALAADDALDEATSLALGRVRAGLVERLAGRDVGPDLVEPRRPHPDLALHGDDAGVGSAANQGHAGHDPVRAAHETAEKLDAVVRVRRLSEHVTAQHDDRVGAEHEAPRRADARHVQRLLCGETLRHDARRFARAAPPPARPKVARRRARRPPREDVSDAGEALARISRSGLLHHRAGYPRPWRASSAPTERPARPTLLDSLRMKIADIPAQAS